MSPECSILPYLGLTNRIAFHFNHRLASAASEATASPIEQRREALLASAHWGLTAWEQIRSIRRWQEGKHAAKSAKGNLNTESANRRLGTVHENEVKALDTAVKSLLAAGCEPWAAALASLASSFGNVDIRLVLTQDWGLATTGHGSHEWFKVRRKFGHLIRQLGFQVFGVEDGQQDVEPEGIETTEIAAVQEVYPALYEDVSHASAPERELWRELSRSLSGSNSLKGLTNSNHKRRKLLHNVYHALAGDGLPETVRELTNARASLIPIMFRLCVLRWRLNWAANLLTMPDGGLTGRDLMDFLRAWQLARGLAPELVAAQSVLHERVRAAFSLLAKGALIEEDYFEGLEVLHSPILSLWDRERGCDSEDIHNRWISNDQHKLAMQTGYNRKRLGLGSILHERTADAGGVSSGLLTELKKTLASISQRLDRRIFWVGFVLAEAPAPVMLGLTISDSENVEEWREPFNAGGSLERETEKYLNDLGTSVKWSGRPAACNGLIAKLATALQKRIFGVVGEQAVVLLCGEPMLASLPWRWLLEDGTCTPTIFTVPSASWMVERQVRSEPGQLRIRTGHGRTAKLAKQFFTTPVVAGESSGLELDSPDLHFRELRRLCSETEKVLDNRCFAGRTGRWRASEWNGNPSALLTTTRCHLLAAPPCEIPQRTADTLAKALEARMAGTQKLATLEMIEELELLGRNDLCAKLYNLYGCP